MPDRKPRPPKNADDPEQSRRFIDTAREVGADETPGGMDRSFDKVIRPPERKQPDSKRQPPPQP
jgi:hypothetical protein